MLIRFKLHHIRRIGRRTRSLRPSCIHNNNNTKMYYTIDARRTPPPTTTNRTVCGRYIVRGKQFEIKKKNTTHGGTI